MNFIFDLHRTMLSRNLILAYHGDVTQDTTKSLLAMAERTLEVSEPDAPVKRKVFKVMVESLQNILKHNEQADGRPSRHPAIFLIGREANGYSVMSGNPVRKASAPRLEAALESINRLDREGLRELHKKIIQGTPLSEKGGAGLGFVDMARKSGEKLLFNFAEMSESHYFFCLKVNVSQDV